MTKNDIKKALYKDNPSADLLLIDKSGIHYEASLSSGRVVYFSVPLSDIQEGRFYRIMEAKLLIRYLNDISET